MQSFRSIFLPFLLRTAMAAMLVVLASIPVAEAQQVGDTIELNAEHADGVPLHAGPRPSMTGRIADGSGAEVIGATADKHWLNVRLPDGRTGWIVPRYIGRVVPPPNVPGKRPALQDQEARVWASRTGCLDVVQAGGRLPKAEPRSRRIATWNIRWFPIGGAPGQDSATPTDIEWLACAITWLDTDLVAVEEMLDTRQAQASLAALLGRLGDLTSHPWRAGFQQCGGATAQHVGFLWNAGTMHVADARDEWRLNGAARSANSPCAGNLRPGYHARVSSLGGGPDFHLIVVHADSGRSERDLGHRERARDRVADVAAQLARTDQDIVILGDWNTMGMDGGISDRHEIADLEAVLGRQSVAFRHLKPEMQCTEYFEGTGGWLDHIVATRAMTELRPESVRVSGYCAIARCAPLSRSAMPAAYRHLSDHCPVVVDLTNSDRD